MSCAPRMLLALLACTLACAAASSSAQAGEWIQVSCVNPDGSAAGSEGWGAMIAGGGYGSTTGSACGPGSPAFALLSSDAAVPVGSAETLRYTPPPGSTLSGGTVDVALRADGYGYDASGTAVAYTPEYGYDAANVFFQCAAGLTPCAGAGNDFTGALTLPPDRGGQLYLSAGCGGQPGASCDEGGSEAAWALVRLYSAELRLRNDATPSGEAFSGTLLSPSARGTAELAFTAGDTAGPGVYRVLVQADGETLYSGVPDDDNGRCMPVGTNAGVLLFDAAQPCRQGESVDLSLPTTGLRDGGHELKVTVSDAAGNQAVVLDRPISTTNAPEGLGAPTLSDAEPTAGEQLSVQPGTWAAPPGAGSISYSYQWQQCNPAGASCQTILGAHSAWFSPTSAQEEDSLRALVTASDSDGSSTLATAPSSPLNTDIPDLPNGLHASEHATLTLSGPRSLTRAYRRRGLTIAGQLLGDGGVPIADATLELHTQTVGGSSAALGFLTTGPDGTFTTHVPPGPSRHITVAYRAFSADGGYAASASVAETVAAGVSLHVTPRRSPPHGTIVLAGRVAGPLPPRGVVVELLVHYRGRWEPFREPVTSADGRFRVRYRFEGAVGSFPFRARVGARQVGFPYSAGASPAVSVRTG